MKTAGGSRLEAHRAGKRLTQRQAILAKCADCMNLHVDGLVDCRMPACPLYPFMPYRGRGPSRSYTATTPPENGNLPVGR